MYIKYLSSPPAVESSIRTRDLLVHFFTLTSRLNSAITCICCATCGSSATVPLITYIEAVPLMDCTRYGTVHEVYFMSVTCSPLHLSSDRIASSSYIPRTEIGGNM